MKNIFESAIFKFILFIFYTFIAGITIDFVLGVGMAFSIILPFISFWLGLIYCIFRYIFISIKNFYLIKGMHSKILDSSALVDGRIVELIKLNFLDGPFIIPNFVLGELHRLSDSENSLKRVRGRRALEFINTIKQMKDIEVIFDLKDFKDVKDVDTKLIELSLYRNAKLITTDFNLTRVAEIRSIKVLNFNIIANAIRVVFLPNEEIEVELVKGGDKDGQAVGYLEDGTMIVVEGGGAKMGKKVIVKVTSMYPTSAGKMIFGSLKK